MSWKAKVKQIEMIFQFFLDYQDPNVQNNVKGSALEHS